MMHITHHVILRAASSIRSSHVLAAIPTPIHSAFCSRASIATQVSTISGLFGIEQLRSASDFKDITEDAIFKANVLRAILRDNEKLASMDTREKLLLLDSISNIVCSVIDAAEFCRHVHTNNEFKKAAENSFESLAHYIHELNADIFIYNVFHSLATSGEEWAALTTEERIFVTDLKREFEAHGIHLDEQTKSGMMAMQRDVVQSETAYMQNAASGHSTFELGPFPSNSNIALLKKWISNYVHQKSYSQNAFYLTCSTDKRLASALMNSIDEEDIRQQLWLSSNGAPVANKEVLGAMIKSRQILAKSLGYESHCHKVLETKVAGSPENVQALIRSLSDASMPQFEKELEELKKMKRCSIQAGATRTDNSRGEGYLQPWDIAYYSRLRAQQQHGGGGGGGRNAQIALREYLSVDACLDGLKHVTNAVFGIKVLEIPMQIEENWAFASDLPNGGLNRACQIRKFEVSDESTGQHLGIVYMDLFGRHQKFAGAAHFTLRCGCMKLRTSNEDIIAREARLRNKKEWWRQGFGGSSSSNNHSISGSNDSFNQIFEEEIQQPIVSLVFSFQPTDLAASTPLLSLDEIVTLHHEWGHALHSLLSRTRFQHLSGVRGPQDFIEVPSHLFEYFARTPGVVSQWARHHTSGERLPSGLLEEAIAEKASSEYAALDIQSQVLYSAADQYMFGSEIGDVSQLSNGEAFAVAERGVCEVQQRYTALPVATGLNERGGHMGVQMPYMNLLDHTHFTSYGGSYYAYLFARVYAAQIWKTRFAADPLSRASGTMLWEGMLQHGASRPPQLLLDDLAGGPADATHLLKYLFP